MMTIATIATMSQRINSPTSIPDISSSLGHDASACADRLELANLFRQCPLDRQTLHRGGAVEAVTAAGLLHDKIGVRRVRDRTAMREYKNVGIDAERGLGPGIDAGRAVLQLQRGLRADRAAG